MPGRKLVEWESDILVDDATNRPLWLTDVVRIMEPDGTTTKGDYRIISIPSIEFEYEPASGIYHRKAKYRGWLIDSVEADFSDPMNSGLVP